MFTTKHSNGREIKSKVIEIRAHSVCAGCNHGWMSDLETKASPLLKPMLKGNTQGLSIEQQACLAQWATKTAMTLDQTYLRQERVFSSGECKQLMDRKMPPPGTGVQLARYAGTGVFLEFGHNDLYRTGIADVSNPGPPDGHRTAIRIDKLICEVNMTSDSNLDLRAANNDVRDILLPIWPSTLVPLAWPPRVAMSNDTWRSFIEPDLPDAGKSPGPGHRGIIRRPAPSEPS
ncbi:MAG TPA: hypothetical protein VN845_12630 [Solirubrobacteraceae bacterium]|nr:hypothetical protein [Solirubrobacteraceae bacterium]